MTSARGVDLMLGWTSDEYRLWLVPGGLLERVDRLGAVALAGAMARCHCGAEVPRGYRALHPRGRHRRDRRPAGHRPPAPPPAAPPRRRPPRTPPTCTSSPGPPASPDLGACHALELGFVFDTGEVPESAKLAGEGAPQELADAMHGAWVRFAVDGDPGWQRWDDTHPVRIFGDGRRRTPRTARATPSWPCGRPTPSGLRRPAPAPDRRRRFTRADRGAAVGRTTASPARLRPPAVTRPVHAGSFRPAAGRVPHHHMRAQQQVLVRASPGCGRGPCGRRGGPVPRRGRAPWSAPGAGRGRTGCRRSRPGRRRRDARPSLYPGLRLPRR